MILGLRGLGGGEHGLRALLVQLVVGLADDIASDVLHILPALELELRGTDAGACTSENWESPVDGNHNAGCSERPTGGAVAGDVFRF